ncbi:MAG: hypothetical protein IJE01_01615 [Clostridia bacterium]|nr:hypothetical protein [Clostridia bacterium]
MNRFKNAIGIIKACGLNIKGDRKLMEEAKQVENTIIEALEKQIPKIDNAEHCVCCGQVIPEGSQYCVICGYKAKHKKTNYDRIRNMSVEEMAEFIKTAVEDCEKYCDFTKNGKCNSFGIEDKCALGIKQWLESEVDTE